MIGTVIGNKYKLLRKIGGGGMADVYKAVNEETGQEVAIKILHQQYVHEEDFVKRFKREADSVSSLSHKNIVEIFDVGEEENLYYIVMEYINGLTLKQLIQREGALTVEEAINIGKQILSALDHAHQHHIVHRDIKPHNILIGINGQVKVTDFGIARAISQATITHTGSVLGSVHYLSPEQARGGWTDEKTDLYSFGIVLYEMLTGKLPFSGDSPITVALKHLQDKFIFPSDINQQIPQSVENIVLKALVKDPNKRYASASQILNDLNTALDPKRRNEPRYQLENDEFDDDEPTMVMSPLFYPNNESDSSYITQSRKSKNNHLIYKKFGFIAFMIILLILLGFSGFQYLDKKLTIPEIDTPQLVGKHIDEVTMELNNLNLTYEIDKKHDPLVEEGYVIKQTPEGGKIKVNQTIFIVISMGKEQIEMPELLHYSEGQAKVMLQQLGFTDIETMESYHDEPAGSIFKQEPESKRKVIPSETRVILFVSKGKESINMPDLIGLNLQQVDAVLKRNDLKLGKVVENYSFDKEAGKVFEQHPFDPGFPVKPGDEISIWISLGPDPETKRKTWDIPVWPDEDEEEAEIEIVIKDARENEIIWKKETISDFVIYQVELLLTPTHPKGEIIVKKNNKIFQSQEVTY